MLNDIQSGERQPWTSLYLTPHSPKYQVISSPTPLNMSMVERDSLVYPQNFCVVCKAIFFDKECPHQAYAALAPKDIPPVPPAPLSPTPPTPQDQISSSPFVQELGEFVSVPHYLKTMLPLLTSIADATPEPSSSNNDNTEMSDSEEIHSTPTEQASTEVDSPNASDSEEVQPSNTKKTYQACCKANSLVNCSSSKKPDAPYKASIQLILPFIPNMG